MFRFFKTKRIDPKAKLQSVLGDYNLPTFPAVMMRALEVMRNPASSAAEVAEVIAMDPGLSILILKTVNSAAYSPRLKVEDVSQAVALLGRSTLESIVVSLAVTDVIPRDSRPGYQFERFWQTSIQRAFLARGFAEVLHPAQKSMSFTAGLLQDMAVPFLASQQEDRYRDILQQWHSDDADLAHLERAAFDWDHAEVATWLCQEWDLPESLALAIGESHGTLDLGGECPSAVKLVSGLKESEEHSGLDHIIETACDLYGMERHQVVELVEVNQQHALDFIQMSK